MNRHVTSILRYSFIAGGIGVLAFFAFGVFVWGGPEFLVRSLLRVWTVFLYPAFWLFDSGSERFYIPSILVSSLAWGIVLYLGVLLRRAFHKTPITR